MKRKDTPLILLEILPLVLVFQWAELGPPCSWSSILPASADVVAFLLLVYQTSSRGSRVKEELLGPFPELLCSVNLPLPHLLTMLPPMNSLKVVCFFFVFLDDQICPFFFLGPMPTRRLLGAPVDHLGDLGADQHINSDGSPLLRDTSCLLSYE